MYDHHPDSVLASFALGALPLDERRQVAVHVSGCPRCELELSAVHETLSSLPLALTPAPGTGGALRQQVLRQAGAAAQVHGEGIAPEAARVAAFFDIPLARAEEVLRAAQEPQRWLVLSDEGEALLAVPAGPQHAGAMGMLARYPAGYCVPRHQHRGEERALVLSGGYRSSEGGVYHPGDELWTPAGACHELYVLPDEPCVLALIIHVGIEFIQEHE